MVNTGKEQITKCRYRPRIFLCNRSILLFDPLYGVPLSAISAFVPVVCRSLIYPGLTY